MSAILAFWDLRIKEEQIVMCVRMLKTLSLHKTSSATGASLLSPA